MGEPVAICLVPWNSDTWTEHILKQIAERTSYPAWRVYISDNSDEPFPKIGPRIEYWWNAENLGYCKALNRALRRCREDIIVIANCDIDLPDGWLTSLVEAYQSTDFGIIGPRMNVRVQSKGIPVDQGAIEVDEAPTLALWITSKSRLWDRIGGGCPEHDWPLTCGDIEIPYLLWKTGGRVGIQTDLFVYHHCCSVAHENMTPLEYKLMIRLARKQLRMEYGPEVDEGRPNA